MIKKLKLVESAKLTEAPEDEEIIDDVQTDLEANEDLEDTVDSEENQEENPVEEESELDKDLDELRDILVDLDLNLYQITSKEDKNNPIYVIGKVAEESDDVLMLIDTKPEEVNDVDTMEDEPIIDNIDVDDEDLNESESKGIYLNKIYNAKTIDEVKRLRNEIENDDNLQTVEIIDLRLECNAKLINLSESVEDVDNVDNSVENTEEVKTELEERFDFVKLPSSFEEINKLNPRYGDELTPDHEAIVEYLMNCLIETNPEAAEELQNKDLEDEPEIPAEPVDNIDLDIDIDGEEENI